MQHRPETDADTVDTADGIKRASAHAARVYRQKCRQIELEETRKGTVKMELEPFLFNDLSTEAGQFRMQSRSFKKHRKPLILKELQLHPSLPLNRSRRFPRNIINNAINPANLVNDPIRNMP